MLTFRPVSKPRTNKFDIFRQCRYIFVSVYNKLISIRRMLFVSREYLPMNKKKIEPVLISRQEAF